MTPMEQLGAASQPTLAAFQSLRKAVLASGPLDERTCELIVTASFATIGSEDSLGATTTFSAVTQALAWLDDIT
jgi:hypothetical protein